MNDQASVTDSPTIVDRLAQSHPHYENAVGGTLENHAVTDVPFLERFKLNTAVLHAHGHEVPVKFLDDGKELFVFDGTPTAINEASQRENLKLTEGQAKSFVQFYFEHVGNNELTIVESASDIASVPCKKPLPWASDADLNSLVKPFQIQSASDHFVVHFNGVWQTLLVDMTMHLQANGTLVPHAQKMLKS